MWVKPAGWKSVQPVSILHVRVEKKAQKCFSDFNCISKLIGAWGCRVERHTGDFWTDSKGSFEGQNLLIAQIFKRLL